MSENTEALRCADQCVGLSELADAYSDAAYREAAAHIRRLVAENEALRSGLNAALDFAGTVAGGASWWADVWKEHEAAIDAARGKT